MQQAGLAAVRRSLASKALSLFFIVSRSCRSQTPRTPACEIEKPSFLISLATRIWPTRIWPKAGCFSDMRASRRPPRAVTRARSKCACGRRGSWPTTSRFLSGSLVAFRRKSISASPKGASRVSAGRDYNRPGANIRNYRDNFDCLREIKVVGGNVRVLAALPGHLSNHVPCAAA